VSDHGLTAAADAVGAILVGAVVLLFVAHATGRTRLGLRLYRPLFVAYALRIASAAVLGLTSLNTSVRGIDETTFLVYARALARLPFSSHQWASALTGHLTIHGAYNAGTLHIFLMALQIRFFGTTELALRTTMAFVSVLGICLVALAVYELGGSRAAKLTAWVLAIEPANVFFSTSLHKEALLYLAVGTVAFGASLAWRRLRIGAFLLMLAGSLIATATATYVGWFLAAGCLAVLLHAAARRLPARARWAVGLGTLGICVGAIAVPSVAQKTQSELASLQQSQNINAQLHTRLGLERVDFSTPGEIAINLPRRMADLMLRPYPWQLRDTNQRLGVVETLFVLALVAVFVRTIIMRRRSFLAIAAPLLYPALLLWVAYSLSVANAGTGFRYRTQIIPLMIGIIFVLQPPKGKPVPENASEPPGSLAVSRV
jgi:hypothetical protein